MRVTLDGVGHRFASRPWLFRGVDAELRPDRTYALTGPSGSGKSTMLALLAGWHLPAEGRVERSGIENVSWVFQGAHGMSHRTAVDHVCIALLAAGRSRADAGEEAVSIMRRFDIDEVADRPFRELSGGEAQRLMFARAIAARPDLLLIDEPTAQLDLATARRVNGVISSLRSPQRIVVVATHDMATRAACTDQLRIEQLSGAIGAMPTETV